MTLAKDIADHMMRNDNFSQNLGLEIISAAQDHCVMGMTVAKMHLNGIGICHGGVYFTLADTAFAHACNSENRVTVAQSCEISFLSPANEGDRLLAEARKVGGTGRSGLYDIMIHREGDGHLMAAFRGHSRTISGTVIATGSEGEENE